MIEINLVPNVKLELIKAERQRNTVISSAILLSIGAGAVVFVLSLYVLGGQVVRQALLDGSIKTEHEKLTKVEDLPKALTIQNQLNILKSQHEDKNITSRGFEVISAIVPTDENVVRINNFVMDTEESTIFIQADAPNGYPALEAFKKTIAATTLRYTEDNELQSLLLATNIEDSERSYGEDATGTRTLRFSLQFTYDETLLKRDIDNAVIVAPGRTNVTDSFLGVPKSLFAPRANDERVE